MAAVVHDAGKLDGEERERQARQQHQQVRFERDDCRGGEPVTAKGDDGQDGVEAV
jgi:hypothetical protein